jgi:hypothetical protein
MTREVPWTDIRAIEAYYVPGVRKQGAANPSNLVAVVIHDSSGAVTLPKELDGFAELSEGLRNRTSCPWEPRLIAHLADRPD